MKPITEEQLQSTINYCRSVIDSEFSFPELKNIAEIALASLTAKPVGSFHISGQSVEATTDYMTDGQWPIDDGELVVYTAPPVPVIPDGYALVPVQPTEEMIIAGFESEPDEDFSDSWVWESYEKMSGCQQAAFKATLCWNAMIDAATSK